MEQTVESKDINIGILKEKLRYTIVFCKAIQMHSYTYACA